MISSGGVVPEDSDCETCLLHPEDDDPPACLHLGVVGEGEGVSDGLYQEGTLSLPMLACTPLVWFHLHQLVARDLQWFINNLSL